MLLLNLKNINVVKRYSFLPVIFLAIIHLFFLYPLFKDGIFSTHDGQMHIARIAAYTKALFSGDFPVRWASHLNYTYGSPIFIFYYPLPYILGSLIHINFEISYINAFKVLLGGAFLLSPISFYFWVKQKISTHAAVGSSLLYGLAPYHFLDLFVRGAIGELFAFVFIPLVFLSIDLISKNKIRLGFLLGAFCYSLLILSHNAFAFLFSLIFVLYASITLKRKLHVFIFASTILMGLATSFFFWFPALNEQKYTLANLLITSTYKNNFPFPSQLFWSSWGFGKRVTESGGLSPQIGPIPIFLFLISLIVTKNKQVKMRYYLFFWLTLVSIFLTTQYSDFLWSFITLLKKFEFPWRMTGVSSFAIAVLSAKVFSSRQGLTISLLTLVSVIIFSLFLTKVESYETFSDAYYESYAHSTDFGAATTRWVAGDPSSPPKAPVEIGEGTVLINKYERRGNAQYFTITAATASTIVANTHYYPGFKAYVNNQETQIQFQDPHHRGLITFIVPEGMHSVTIAFTETKSRLMTNIISAASFALLFLLLSMTLAANLKNRKK